MSDPPRFVSLPPPSLLPGPQVNTPLAEFLRAELDSAPPGSLKAVFLHELAALEERGGDEMGAARDFLASFNAAPHFREPLEGLVRLLERRKSVKNLPKLLDALLRSSDNAEERARALAKRAAFLSDTKGDLEACRDALLEGASLSADDPLFHLELEVVAARMGDTSLRLQALTARAELAANATWRGHLLLAGADVASSAGQGATAEELARKALATEGGARFAALEILEKLARREPSTPLLIETLEARAEMLLASLDGSEAGDRFGIPHRLQTPEAAADCLLRASLARRAKGDLLQAAALLDQALAAAGERPVLLTARLGLAEALDDVAAIEHTAHALLGQGFDSRARSSLWVRIARAAMLRSDAGGALEAAQEALRADPGSLAARALEIDLASATRGPEALAGALDGLAAILPGEEAKGRASLLAAHVYGAEANNPAAAKAALSQAAARDIAPNVIGRVARLLATIAGDSAWQDESILGLLTSTGDDKERQSLWFELGRNRLLRGDQDGAAQAFESLAAVPGGGWLGHALAAYSLSFRRTEAATPDGTTAAATASASTLDLLRQSESAPAVLRALTIAAARRDVRAGALDAAAKRLGEHLEREPSDLVAALFLARLEQRAGRPSRSIRAVTEAADLEANAGLAAKLYVEGGLSAFRQGEREAAVAAFEAAFGRDAALAAPVLAWALRAGARAPGATEDEWYERASEQTGDRAILALRRVAAELSDRTPDPARLSSRLDDCERAATLGLGEAVALARVIADGAFDSDALSRALDALAASSDAAAPLVASESLRRERAAGDHKAACRAARQLAESSASLAGALEWLAAAWRARDPREEAEARRAVAAHFEGDARAAIEASAAMIGFLEDPGAEHPLLEALAPAALWTNYDLAPSGQAPERRARAASALAEALPESDEQVDVLLFAGYNWLAQGDAREALACFERAVGLRVNDLGGWEGVRAAAELLEDASRQALANERIGSLCRSTARAAVHWERAGLLHSGKLDDPDRAEACFEQAFECDPRRGVAFDRLFRRVRDRNEADRLLALVTRRLGATEEPVEIAKLYWERARTLRQKGEVEGALTALENVTLIEPNHVGALALRAEMDIAQSNFESAASNLARLASLDEAPPQQRLMSGVAAADLYENKLGQTPRAMDILLSLQNDGLTTLPVRERLARAAIKTGAWDKAVEVLDGLTGDRPTPQGRVEAARLSMAIWRDKLRAPQNAETAVVRLLNDAPEDGEALDFVMQGKFDPELSRELLEQGKRALVETVDEGPPQRDKIQRLARLAAATGDMPLRQATLGALKSIVGPTPEVERELAELEARVARTPQVALDDATLLLLSDPDDGGPLAELFCVLGPTIAEALGPSLDALGVNKKQKIEPRSGLPLRNEIAAWAGALGLGEFDLYIGGRDPAAIQGVAADVPSLVIGPEVAAPLTPHGRQAIVRELFALRRGITIARTRDEVTLAAIVVASCNLAEVPIEAPPYAVLGDVQRLLGKALARRTRRILPELCRRVVETEHDPRIWARAALASMYRIAALAAGDVSLVLSDALGVPTAKLPFVAAQDDRARRLVAFVLSPHYLELRSRLGMGVR